MCAKRNGNGGRGRGKGQGASRGAVANRIAMFEAAAGADASTPAKSDTPSPGRPKKLQNNVPKLVTVTPMKQTIKTVGSYDTSDKSGPSEQPDVAKETEEDPKKVEEKVVADEIEQGTVPAEAPANNAVQADPASEPQPAEQSIVNDEANDTFTFEEPKESKESKEPKTEPKPVIQIDTAEDEEEDDDDDDNAFGLNEAQSMLDDLKSTIHDSHSALNTDVDSAHTDHGFLSESDTATELTMSPASTRPMAHGLPTIIPVGHSHRDGPITPVKQVLDVEQLDVGNWNEEEAPAQELDFDGEFGLQIDPDTYFSGSDDEIIESHDTPILPPSRPQFVGKASPILVESGTFNKAGLTEITTHAGNQPRAVDLSLDQDDNGDSTLDADYEFEEVHEAPAAFAMAKTVNIGSPKPIEISFTTPQTVMMSGDANPISPVEPLPARTISTVQPTQEMKSEHQVKSLTVPTIQDVSKKDLQTSPSAKSDTSITTVKPLTKPTISVVGQVGPVESTTTASQQGPYQATTPTTSNASTRTVPTNDLIVGVCVVGFHHMRGPEVEYWVGPEGDQSDIWPYLPFQSLPDGSHSFEENLCYFTLLYDKVNHMAPNPTPKRDEHGEIIGSTDYTNVETLFAISCTRQVPSSSLINRPADVTRSNVQKSVVVVARKPIYGPIKEKLTVVTRSFFEQYNFEDREIIDNLYDNLIHMFNHNPMNEGYFQVGTSVREVLYNFNTKLLVLVKALLLEKKLMFFSNDTERLCTTQFAIISLISNLANHLEDAGSPMLSTYEKNLYKPTHLKTSERESLLKFMGLPLQVFGEGGFFSPFVPLQQIQELKHPETKYGMFGSTNQLFLSSGVECDLIINVDNYKIDIVNKDLKPLLDLTSADKDFMKPLYQSVVNSWDSENKWQPSSLHYIGSEDFIRHQFEDYIMGLLSSVKYDNYLARIGPQPAKIFTRDYAPDPLKAFNLKWTEEWKKSNNYRIFQKFTDDELFDVVEPIHIGTIKNRKRVDAITDPREPSHDLPVQDDGIGRIFGNMFWWNSRSSAQPVVITSDSKPSESESVAPTEETAVEETKTADASTLEEANGESANPKRMSALNPRSYYFWKTS